MTPPARTLQGQNRKIIRGQIGFGGGGHSRADFPPIKNIILTCRIKRAVKLANTLAQNSKRRYLVLMVKGVPRVYSKQELKVLINRRIFRRGTTIQDLEKVALHITR